MCLNFYFLYAYRRSIAGGESFFKLPLPLQRVSPHPRCQERGQVRRRVGTERWLRGGRGTDRLHPPMQSDAKWFRSVASPWRGGVALSPGKKITKQQVIKTGLKRMQLDEEGIWVGLVKIEHISPWLFFVSYEHCDAFLAYFLIWGYAATVN